MTLYIVPDPALPATYGAGGGPYQWVMGDKLVEYRNAEGTDQLWQIGNLAGLFATGDEVMIADNAVVGYSSTGVMTVTATQALVIILTDDGGFQYWIVNADGTQTTLAGGTSADYNPAFTDQRLEAGFRGYKFNAADATDLKPIPSGATAATLFDADPTALWTHADTWAAFVAGDNTSARTQPIAPAPFNITKESLGNHTLDHEMIFNYYSETGDKFTGAWSDARITWFLDPAYTGPVPVMNFGRLRVETLVSDIPASSATELHLSSVAQTSCASGYLRARDPSGASITGAPAIFLAETGQPDGLPENIMDSVSVTLTGTIHYTPAAAHAYRVGEYRYLNAALDELSGYTATAGGAPGTEWMRSDFLDAVDGRRTAVVGLLQEADYTGGGTQCSLAVHFEPLAVASIAGVLGAPRVRFY